MPSNVQFGTLVCKSNNHFQATCATEHGEIAEGTRVPSLTKDKGVCTLDLSAIEGYLVREQEPMSFPDPQGG